MSDEKKYFARELMEIIRDKEKYNRKIMSRYLEILEENNELRIAFIKAADARDKLVLEIEEIRSRVA